MQFAPASTHPTCSFSLPRLSDSIWLFVRALEITNGHRVGHLDGSRARVCLILVTLCEPPAGLFCNWKLPIASGPGPLTEEKSPFRRHRPPAYRGSSALIFSTFIFFVCLPASCLLLLFPLSPVPSQSQLVNRRLWQKTSTKENNPARAPKGTTQQSAIFDTSPAGGNSKEDTSCPSEVLY